MDTVGHDLILDIGDVAVAIDAGPFQAAGIRQPVDVCRSAVGQILDQLLVDQAFAFLDPHRCVVLRRVVLILGKLLLILGTGCLHDAAGEVGGAADNAGLFQHQYLDTGCRRFRRCGDTGSAAADDQNVGFQIPVLFRRGEDGRADQAHGRDAGHARCSAFQK